VNSYLSKPSYLEETLKQNGAVRPSHTHTHSCTRARTHTHAHKHTYIHARAYTMPRCVCVRQMDGAPCGHAHSIAMYPCPILSFLLADFVSVCVCIWVGGGCSGRWWRACARAWWRTSRSPLSTASYGRACNSRNCLATKFGSCYTTSPLTPSQTAACPSGPARSGAPSPSSSAPTTYAAMFAHRDSV
jgi:hypothetical protein